MAQSTYRCGVERPIFLNDGRVVTSEAPFELDVQTPHDESLVTEGLIVKLDEQPATPAPAAENAGPANTQADTTASSSSSKQKGA